VQGGEAIVTLDHLIDRWRVINADVRLPWVLLEHGTCVTIADPGDDLLAQAAALVVATADALLAEQTAGEAIPCADGGWLVAAGDAHVRTYVQSVAMAAGAGGDERDASAVSLWGRSICARDAREFGVVHVEDARENRDETAVACAEAWAQLVRRAQHAQREGSDWERFGLPVSALQLLDEADQDRPPVPLDELDLAADVRETTEVLEEMIRDAPRQNHPFTVFVGLRPGEHVPQEILTAECLARRYPRGSVVSLTGFVCTAGRTEPPLYAAKAGGAMLAIKVTHAAPLTKPGDGPDEYEFLLPRDCRCVVQDVLAEGLFPNGSGSGSRSRRVTLRLEQLPS
jgi:hypothetical protein